MTTSTTRVSVPGKLILMGEHAAVYGRPAMVASIGLRMRVQLTPEEGSAVRLDLPDVGLASELTWAEIHDRTRRVRKSWRAFSEDPSPEAFERLRPEGARELVELALGESARELGESGDASAEQGLRLGIESDIPVGSGFGSSAAAAVGIVVAYLASRDADHGAATVGRIALEVERRQHGFPSGVDSATVYHGGVLWCARTAVGLETEPLAVDPEALRRFRVLDTGAPAESTGTVVADVRARRDRDPEAFDEMLAEMEAATREFRHLLVAGVEGDALLEPIRAYQRRLESLGVVPGRVRELVRAVERAGGAAKISGAGSLTGRGAGSLLVVGVEPSDVPALGRLEPLAAALGVEGARLESVA